MPNPFDQFDGGTAVTDKPARNPFDDFDAAPPKGGVKLLDAGKLGAVSLQIATQSKLPDPNANSTDLLSEVVNDPAAPVRALGTALKPVADVTSTLLNIPGQVWDTAGRMGLPLARNHPAGNALVTPEQIEQAIPAALEAELGVPLPDMGGGEPAAVTGLKKSAAKLVSGFTTPQMLATLPAAELRPIQLLFGANMLSTAPETVSRAIETLKDPDASNADKWESGGDAFAHIAMAYAGLKGIKPEEVKQAVAPDAAAEAVEQAKGGATPAAPDLQPASEPTPPVTETPPVVPQPEAEAAAPSAPVASPLSVEAYRGISPSNLGNRSKTGFRFFSESEDEAAAYGKVSKEKLTFANPLIADNWMEAKQRLSLPASATMDEVLTAAKNAGHDGVAWTHHGKKEFVDLAQGAQSAPVASEAPNVPSSNVPTPDAIVDQPVKNPPVDNPSIEAQSPPGGTGAETITGSNEQKGSAMPAELGEIPNPSPSRSKPKTDRPPDILDDIDDHHGGKINLAQARLIIPDLKPTGLARKYFSASSPYGPDQVLHALQAEGLHKNIETDEEFLRKVLSAPKQRVAARKSGGAESLAIQEGAKQAHQFSDKVLQGKYPAAEKANIETAPIGHLFEGDTFEVQGHKFEVSKMDIDEDGQLISVTLKDGPKFGVQHINGDEVIHFDKGSLETSGKAVEFLPEQESASPSKSDDPFEMDLGDAKKSPEELAAAARKKAMQDEMDQLRTKRLGAPGADTTMDMLDPTKADNPLLAHVQKPTESPFTVAGYNDTTKMVTDSKGNIYSLVRTIKKKNGDLAYEVKGYSKLEGKYPELEQVYHLRGEDEAIAAAKQIAANETGSGEQKIIGMGGAVPSEFGKPESFVSNMFAAIDKERAEMGKPPMPDTKARTWDEDNTRALNRMNADPNWIPDLIKEVKASPRPLLSWENAGMVWQKAKWKAEADNALQRIARAFDDGRTEDLQQARLENALREDQLTELNEVVGRNGTGTEAGRSLNAQKMAAGDDFSLVEMRLKKRAANGGARLTEAQEKEIADLHAKLEATQKAFDQHKAEQAERISKMQADATLNRIKAEAGAPPKIHPAIIEAAKKIVAKLDTRADAARERLKARLGRTSAGLDPTILVDLAEVGASHLAHAVVDVAEWSAKMLGEFGKTIEPHLKEIYAASEKLVKDATKDNLEAAREMRKKSPEEQIAANDAKIGEKIKAGKKNDIAWYVQRIARLLVQSGVTDREALIGRVHEILQKHLPDLTRRQTMDAISGYGDFKQLSKDQISLQLRGMRGEMQQLSKLEDMAKGQPPLKTGVERRTPTEAERKLVKLVNESKFRFQVPITDPATQLKSALDTFKTNMRNRTADLQDRIDRGDYQKAPKRTLQLDNEAMRLKAENERVKQKFQQGLNRDRLKQRTPWEKTQDAVVKWRRGFILSGPVTLAKLTSAALARAIITPVEEGIGAGIGKVFPSLSERAPREGGGFNTRAEVKALTEGITTGMRDAWSTFRTGKSPLDLVHGKDPGLPQSFIDIFGNIHGALKAPVKRAEFARSFEKRADYYAKQGVDVTDEFVQTRIGLEAYQDAQRAIFMQKNWLVNKVNRAFKADIDPKTGHPSLGQKALETAGSVLMPIRRVPTNIVAETMQYAIGSVTGSVRLAKAYHDGIANLKPEEADLILRQLKKGSLGGAVMLLGFLSPNVLGGFYQQGQKRDKKDIPPDAARVGDLNIPAFVIHNPWMSAAQIGATVRRVADSKLRKKDKETQGLSSGALAGAIGLADATPFIRETTEIAKLMNPYERSKWLGEMAKSMVVPQGLNTLAQFLDQNSKGETVKRDPKNPIQAIETGIPGLRQNVPAKK